MIISLVSSKPTSSNNSTVNATTVSEQRWRSYCTIKTLLTKYTKTQDNLLNFFIDSLLLLSHISRRKLEFFFCKLTVRGKFASLFLMPFFCFFSVGYGEILVGFCRKGCAKFQSGLSGARKEEKTVKEVMKRRRG